MMTTSDGEGGPHRKAAQDWLRFLGPALARLRTYAWSGADEDQYWYFLRAAALVRQAEALEATLDADDRGAAHFSVTLVRPAYEELLWIDYLRKHEDVANELVTLLARVELSDGLTAQNEYLGVRVMAGIGFSQKSLKRRLAALRRSEARLREIGARLGWRQGALSPSFAKVAREVGREKEYGFVYQGTSRHVHFSTQELFRRVWGRKGMVSIGSGTFSSYWRDFAIYWQLRTLVLLVTNCHDMFENDDLDPELERIARGALAEAPPVQIVTASELETWPS